MVRANTAACDLILMRSSEHDAWHRGTIPHMERPWKVHITSTINVLLTVLFCRPILLLYMR